ncbi:MAG TPA: ABC transporter substrate-binding protein, partial [Firmicutes bacterium]|nr:ABC transporter substrate-binding protein [Bacillota bacterium]
DIVLQTILKEKGLLDSVEIVYYNAVSDVQALVASNEVKIALIAEPSLTVLKSKVDNIETIIDCQAMWGELYDVTSYPQASVFIHHDLIENAPNTVNTLLKDIEASVTYANENPEAMAEEAIATGLDMPAAVIANSSKMSNLNYKSAKDAKAEIELYLQKLYEFQPNTIGGQLPDEDFYYLGK